MKYFDLDKYEQELLDAYESGKLKSVPKAKQAGKLYQKYAKGSLDKTLNINIRVQQGDWLKFRALAMQKGLRSQTMLSAIIHQVSTGQVKQDFV